MCVSLCLDDGEMLNQPTGVFHLMLPAVTTVFSFCIFIHTFILQQYCRFLLHSSHIHSVAIPVIFVGIVDESNAFIVAYSRYGYYHITTTAIASDKQFTVLLVEYGVNGTVVVV